MLEVKSRTGHKARGQGHKKNPRPRTQKKIQGQGQPFREQTLSRPVVPERGGRGAAAPPALLPGGARGQYCPLHFSTVVTKRTPANQKSSLI